MRALDCILQARVLTPLHCDVLAPYMATPPEVVERMLRLAAVGADDLVYDLGCGDGRILIAAACAGASGVGVDIESHWVELSRLNANAAGVAERVRFEQADALSLDLRQATVVVLYLVHWSVQRVLARVRSQCAPGTRVVSHSFPIELDGARSEWVIDAEGQRRQIHLWTVPDARP